MKPTFSKTYGNAPTGRIPNAAWDWNAPHTFDEEAFNQMSSEHPELNLGTWKVLHYGQQKWFGQLPVRYKKKLILKICEARLAGGTVQFKNHGKGIRFWISLEEPEKSWFHNYGGKWKFVMDDLMPSSKPNP